MLNKRQNKKFNNLLLYYEKQYKRWYKYIVPFYIICEGKLNKISGKKKFIDYIKNEVKR